MSSAAEMRTTATMSSAEVSSARVAAAEAPATSEFGRVSTTRAESTSPAPVPCAEAFLRMTAAENAHPRVSRVSTPASGRSLIARPTGTRIFPEMRVPVTTLPEIPIHPAREVRSVRCAAGFTPIAKSAAIVPAKASGISRTAEILKTF